MTREVRTSHETDVYELVYTNEDDWKQTLLGRTPDQFGPYQPGDYERYDGKTMHRSMNGGPEGAEEPEPDATTVPGVWFRTAESLISTAGGGQNDPAHWYYEVDEAADQTLLTLHTSYDKTEYTFLPTFPLPISIREYSLTGELLQEEVATSLIVRGEKVF